MEDLANDGLKPSISGDIWSENGAGIFAAMSHWISRSWTLERWLAFAEPYGSVSHTGAKIARTTKMRLSDVKIGVYAEEDTENGVDAVDTVYESTFIRVSSALVLLRRRSLLPRCVLLSTLVVRAVTLLPYICCCGPAV